MTMPDDPGTPDRVENEDRRAALDAAAEREQLSADIYIASMYAEELLREARYGDDAARLNVIDLTRDEVALALAFLACLHARVNARLPAAPRSEDAAALLAIAATGDFMATHEAARALDEPLHAAVALARAYRDQRAAVISGAAGLN